MKGERENEPLEPVEVAGERAGERAGSDVGAAIRDTRRNVRILV